MLAFFYHLSVGIGHVKLQTAELSTLATIGTASETSLTNIALSAIANTQSTMYKDLKQRIGTCRMHTTYLIDRQFAGQHHLSESGIRQKADLFYRAVIHLRTGMQRDGRQIKLSQTHILNNERIYSYPIQIPNHSFGFLQLVIAQYCVYGYVYTHII